MFGLYFTVLIVISACTVKNYNFIINIVAITSSALTVNIYYIINTAEILYN